MGLGVDRLQSGLDEGRIQLGGRPTASSAPTAGDEPGRGPRHDVASRSTAIVPPQLAPKADGRTTVLAVVHGQLPTA